MSTPNPSPTRPRRRRDLAVLDTLGADHPALSHLTQTPQGRALVDQAPALARYLLGAAPAEASWLSGLLADSAPEDMAILRTLCDGKVTRSAAATVALVQHLASRLRPAPAKPGGDLDARGGQCANPGGAAGGASGDGDASMPSDVALPKGHDGEPSAEALETGAMTSDAFDALARYDALVEALQAAVPGGGWGTGAAHIERALIQDLHLQARLLQRLDTLQRIADALGRVESESRPQQRAERGGRANVTGVRFSADLSDVLPAEWALLSTRATEDLFYQRYTEGRLLALETEGLGMRPEHDSPQRRGPVIACIDTSGSMSGPREIVAKALVLAVLRRVLPQGRAVRLMLFGGPGDFRDEDIKPGNAGLRTLMEFLSMGFNAGTDYDGPLERALDLLQRERYQRADLLIVTDGYCEAGDAIVQRLQDARETIGVRVTSVIVSGESAGVEPFSDHIWAVAPDGDSPATVDLDQLR